MRGVSRKACVRDRPVELGTPPPSTGSPSSPLRSDPTQLRACRPWQRPRRARAGVASGPADLIRPEERWHNPIVEARSDRVSPSSVIERPGATATVAMPDRLSRPIGGDRSDATTRTRGRERERLPARARAILGSAGNRAGTVATVVRLPQVRRAPAVGPRAVGDANRGRGRNCLGGSGCQRPVALPRRRADRGSVDQDRHQNPRSRRIRGALAASDPDLRKGSVSGTRRAKLDRPEQAESGFAPAVMWDCDYRSSGASRAKRERGHAKRHAPGPRRELVEANRDSSGRSAFDAYRLARLGVESRAHSP